MTLLSRLGRGFLLGALLCSVVVPAAPAQQAQTLTIRDGSVFVDGRQLSSGQVPDDLDLEGITARYRFVGIQRPVIELNGQLYAVADGLTPVSEEEVNAKKSSVILQEIDARPDAATSDQRLRAQSEGSQATEDASSDQREYLSEVQRANRDLYERLLRERSMEKQAQDLARVIRMLPEDSEERAARIDSLRGLLNTIFDLKQENRRREIERLQREIQELQRRLQKRKRMRDAMIDHRLNQLVTSSSGSQ